MSRFTVGHRNPRNHLAHFIPFLDQEHITQQEIDEIFLNYTQQIGFLESINEEVETQCQNLETANKTQKKTIERLQSELAKCEDENDRLSHTLLHIRRNAEIKEADLREALAMANETIENLRQNKKARAE